MKIFKADSKVAMRLVPINSHRTLRQGCACRSHIEGIFVKKLDVNGKYHVYVHEHAIMPDELEVSEPEKGPGRMVFKPKAKKEKRKKAKEA